MRISGEHGGPELAVTLFTLLLARRLGSVRDVVRESAVLRALLAATRGRCVRCCVRYSRRGGAACATRAAPAASSGRRRPRVARALDAGHLSGGRGK